MKGALDGTPSPARPNFNKWQSSSPKDAGSFMSSHRRIKSRPNQDLVKSQAMDSQHQSQKFQFSSYVKTLLGDVAYQPLPGTNLQNASISVSASSQDSLKESSQYYAGTNIKCSNLVAGQLRHLRGARNASGPELPILKEQARPRLVGAKQQQLSQRIKAMPKGYRLFQPTESTTRRSGRMESSEVNSTDRRFNERSYQIPKYSLNCDRKSSQQQTHRRQAMPVEIGSQQWLN